MALVATILTSEIINSAGLRDVTVSLALDNNYIVGGWPLTPAMFGLVKYEVDSRNTGFIYPVVLYSNFPSVILAIGVDDTAGLAFLGALYPTGGNGPVFPLDLPTVPIDPASFSISGAPSKGTLAVTAGALAVTSSAANGAADITGAPGVGSLALAGGFGAYAISPGVGVEVQASTDFSGLNCVLRVRGYRLRRQA